MKKKEDLSNLDKAEWEEYIKNPKDIFDKDLEGKKSFGANYRFRFDLHGFTLSDANQKIRELIISCYEKNSEQIYKTFELNIEKNRVTPLFGIKTATSNRQKLPKTVMPNGAFYIFKIKKKSSFYPINFKDCYAYLMNKNEVIDINSKKDLNLARKTFKNKLLKNA